MHFTVHYKAVAHVYLSSLSLSLSLSPLPLSPQLPLLPLSRPPPQESSQSVPSLCSLLAPPQALLHSIDRAPWRDSNSRQSSTLVTIATAQAAPMSPSLQPKMASIDNSVYSTIREKTACPAQTIQTVASRSLTLSSWTLSNSSSC